MPESVRMPGPVRLPESVRQAGSRSLLVEFPTLEDALAFQATIALHPLPGQRDVVSGACTVLVEFAQGTSLAEAASAIRSVPLAVGETASPRARMIDVVYDGPDLEAVAEATGLSVHGVIAVHSGQAWRVAFCGFAPGFAYLLGENDVLDVPRRDVPRVGVPAGAVGLAGRYSAVYPSESPGGWQLLGRTGTPMWDLANDPPALLVPGDTVRFSPVRESIRVAAPSIQRVRAVVASGLEIVRTGFLATVQDLGRPGRSALGVGTSGAVDRASLRAANRLVGNLPGAAAIELSPGGFCARAIGDQVVAVAGAHTSVTITDDDGEREEILGQPFLFRDGSQLAIGAPEAGFRSYLAVRGGVEVEPQLGSRSTDVLSRIGPEPLAAGDQLAAGSDAVDAVDYDLSFGERPGGPLPVILGPRSDWFSAEAIESFLTTEWTVTAESNRVGIRLESETAIHTIRNDQLESEGVANGSIQIPPSGEPIIFLADHPVTGGYPVIAVIADEALDRAGQLAPGDTLTFRLVAPEVTVVRSA